MASYSRLEVVLVRYPFTDLSDSKVRPVVVVSSAHPSQDLVVVALTSKTSDLQAGEFIPSQSKKAGLNIEAALKRGFHTLEETLVLRRVGVLDAGDAARLEQSLRAGLNLP